MKDGVKLKKINSTQNKFVTEIRNIPRYIVSKCPMRDHVTYRQLRLENYLPQEVIIGDIRPLQTLSSWITSSGSLFILLTQRPRTVMVESCKCQVCPSHQKAYNTYPERSLLVTSSLSRPWSWTISSGSLLILLSLRSRTDMEGRCSRWEGVISLSWLLPRCNSCKRDVGLSAMLGLSYPCPVLGINQYYGSIFFSSRANLGTSEPLDPE